MSFRVSVIREGKKDDATTKMFPPPGAGGVNLNFMQKIAEDAGSKFYGYVLYNGHEMIMRQREIGKENAVPKPKAKSRAGADVKAPALPPDPTVYNVNPFEMKSATFICLFNMDQKKLVLKPELKDATRTVNCQYTTILFGQDAELCKFVDHLTKGNAAATREKVAYAQTRYNAGVTAINTLKGNANFMRPIQIEWNDAKDAKDVKDVGTIVLPKVTITVTDGINFDFLAQFGLCRVYLDLTPLGTKSPQFLPPAFSTDPPMLDAAIVRAMNAIRAPQ